MNRAIHWLTPSFAIGKVTFLEIVRDKILYNILLIAIGLIGFGLLSSYLAYVKPVRLMKDFGLASIMISCTTIGILVGSNLLKREMERRTIFVALSKPITKYQFLFGKYFGISAVLLVNWLILSASVVFVTYLFARSFGSFSYLVLGVGCILALMEGLLLCALSIFFSSFTTPSLAVVFTVATMIIGNNISELKILIEKLDPSVVKSMLPTFLLIIPNFEVFHLGFQITYDLPPTFYQFGITTLYWLAATLILLLIAGLVVSLREV